MIEHLFRRGASDNIGNGCGIVEEGKGDWSVERFIKLSKPFGNSNNSIQTIWKFYDISVSHLESDVQAKIQA